MIWIIMLKDDDIIVKNHKYRTNVDQHEGHPLGATRESAGPLDWVGNTIGHGLEDTR
jgi:hypothetical protein